MKTINSMSILLFIFLFLGCSQQQKAPYIKEEPKEIPAKKEKDVEYRIEPFVTGLTVPWSIVFTSSDRILVTERIGKVRIIKNGILQSNPAIEIAEVSTGSEEGLMGLALDPDYAVNKFVYLCYAYLSGKYSSDNMRVKVKRYVDSGDILIDDNFTLIDDIPGAKNHCGGRIKFGPGSKLYISAGDATDWELAQDLNKLNGKILRINKDGSIPLDNPFPGSTVWVYGIRNAQGMDWFPGSNVMIESEHGPSGFDGPGGGDEVNIIEKGQNYGWPIVSHTRTKEGMMSPIAVFTPAEAPGSGMIYKGNTFPQFKNNFFFGCLRGRGIMRIVFDANDYKKVVSYEKLQGIDFGRIRDVSEGPDGFIYFSTSNKDGRGNPANDDDKIYVIKPK
ncbi:PQQ-dependent sugar dehydrogenase [soil metagenome]